MQSLVKSSKILIRNEKCIERLIRRSIRLQPLIIDKPPDYYPTIDMKLNQLNYYENAMHLTDIGFKDDSEVKQRFLSIRRLIQNSHKSEINDLEEDIEEDAKQDLNYKQIYEKWLLTEEGIKTIIDLANHYAIFRDLFPPAPSLEAKSPIEEPPPKPIYYFSPLVPIDVEFCVNESELETNGSDESSGSVSKSQSNNIIVSRVFRGNLILSENCMNAPNVTIDSSAINGINNSDICNEHEVSAEESSGRITLLNDEQNYYTLALINLDSHFGNESNVCHWLLSNIHNKDKVTNSETIIKYLPVYGIRGLGYHRFVFVLYKHNKPLSFEKINDFVLEKRKFDAFKLMSSHGEDTTITPIGLSWFQSTWDYSSQKVIYDYLDMRSPTYEWILPKEKYFKQLQYPLRAPFNIYLDRFRDPKELAKSALLERLSSINPYNYKNMFDVNPVPQSVHPIPPSVPDWMKSQIFRRREKMGIYRHLRPHSAIIPLNNNPDLDKPKWPRISPKVQPLNLPITYPDGHRRPKNLKDTLWVKPPHEHPNYRIDFPHEDLDESDRKHLKTDNK